MTGSCSQCIPTSKVDNLMFDFDFDFHFDFFVFVFDFDFDFDLWISTLTSTLARRSHAMTLFARSPLNDRQKVQHFDFDSTLVRLSKSKYRYTGCSSVEKSQLMKCITLTKQ